MPSAKEIRDYFKEDRFALGQGITIDSVEEDGAVCSVLVEERHLNAAGSAQGGLIFTLADFTFAVAANSRQKNTVTLASEIHYLKPAWRGLLSAKATCVEQSKTVCVYNVQVTDAAGVLIAQCTMTGYAKRPKETNAV